VSDKWRKHSLLRLSANSRENISRLSAAHRGQNHMLHDGDGRKMTFICDSSPRRHHTCTKAYRRSNDRRGKMKRVRILGSLSRCFTGCPPIAAWTTQVSHTSIPTPDLSELCLALAVQFPMRVSVHRPVLSVLPEGCVACRRREWRRGQSSSSDTIFDARSRG